MEQPKRKFRSDISNKSIDAVLDKRQRKRSHPKNSPYEDHRHDKSAVMKAMAAITSDGQTVIREIPPEMLPKNKAPFLAGPVRREYEKPEHWIKPKDEPTRSRAEVFLSERENVAKMVGGYRVTYCRAAQILQKANREPLRVPASNLTAKGYITCSKQKGKK